MFLAPRLVHFLAALACLLAGCVGDIRETTTVRTSTEQLLVSSAAERAIAQFENVEKECRGRRVAVDDTRFESYDKAYAVSAFRHYLAEHGAILVPLTPQKVKLQDGREVDLLPERIVEIRSGALGVNDTSWGVGIPALPFPIPNTTLTTLTPPAYLFFKGKQEGWAKFQLWIYDPVRSSYVARSRDLWGHSYYSKWWILFVGPFDLSNDIYPDDDGVVGDQPLSSRDASEGGPAEGKAPPPPKEPEDE